MKTNKHLMLLFIEKNEGVRAKDIVNEFDYSSGTARSYLSYLTKQNLLERSALGHVLTEKGRERLQFFETMGCDNIECPLCHDKKAGSYSCTRCGFQISKEKARIKPERDFLLGVRHAGVYCPLCMKLMFTEKQAQLIGIKREE